MGDVELSTLAEHEDVNGEIPEVGSIAWEGIKDNPHEVILFLLPHRPVDREPAAYRLSRSELVSHVRTVLQELDPTPQDVILAELRAIRKLLEDQD